MTTARKVTKNFRVEGATLIFKNFSGKPSKYNKEGDRNFAVLLSEEDAEKLGQDGWNVKYLAPRDIDIDTREQAYLPVKIRFDPYPPVCQLIKFGKRYPLDAENIDQLDWTPSINVDLVIRPYNYDERPGRPAGVSAYLKAIYYTAAEDDFERKYASIPMAGSENDLGDDEEEIPFA